MTTHEFLLLSMSISVLICNIVVLICSINGNRASKQLSERIKRAKKDSDIFEGKK